MTPLQAARIKRAVTRLIKAEVADSWKGGGDPNDIPAIEAELKLARKHFDEVLREATTHPTPRRPA